MIVRSVVCSLVLALPFVATAQASRASTGEFSGTEVPVVRVWIPNTLNFRYGQMVPVSFEVSEAAHVAVFRIDGRGRMQVLWPQRNSLQTAAKSGHEYRVSSPYSAYGAFTADYELGQGMVIAIASPDPIDLSAFRRYRNDANFYHYANLQQPYVGGVTSIVDRLSQELLYAPDSPYDFDVAFYSSSGGSRYSALCSGYSRYPRWGWTTYSAWFAGSPSLGYLDDCYNRGYYGGYLAYCSAWHVFYGYFDSQWCRFGNPWWQSTPGPIAGTPQPQPRPSNADMIDTIMSRPVALERNGDQSASGGTSGGNGSTKVVIMEPVRDPPNGTLGVTADENDAISLPARVRREPAEPTRGGVGFNTREEGFARSPGSGIRADDPRDDSKPGRTPGTAFMPPVREPPRPVTVWRDTDRGNGGSSYSAPQRWERPTMSQPTHPGGGSSSGHIDRGSTSTGTSSPASTGATVTPRTDASVTKSDGGTKASDAKTTGERKPQ